MLIDGKITTLKIERSNPDRIVARGKNGRSWTALEDLRERGRGRSDIFMVLFQRQIGEEDYQSRQLWVYPTGSGDPNFGEAGDWMTFEEKEWCRAENARLLALAKIHPEYAKLLGIKPGHSVKV